MKTHAGINVTVPTAPLPTKTADNKALFLDVDGVLCSWRAHFALGNSGGIWYEWDPIAIEAIRRACTKGVTIVVSSTWRMPGNRQHLLDQLTKHDLIGYVHKSDPYTPQFNRQRGHEIADWLTRHPEVTSYRILDDDCDMMEEQMPYLIHTDGSEGMTSENIRALLRWSRWLKS